MDNIEFKRKSLSKTQTNLRKILSSSNIQEDAVGLLLNQHQRLHSKNTSKQIRWSFQDAILNDIDETSFRRIPKNCEHSIAWCIWHLARIEDIAMNILVVGDKQILIEGNWQHHMKATARHSGNGMYLNEIKELSQKIDLSALKEYRSAVGKKTQEIIKRFDPEKYKDKVLQSRIDQVKEEGAVIESAYTLTDYWSKRTIAGLFLMPATRHNIVHLNEALQLKKRVR